MMIIGVANLAFQCSQQNKEMRPLMDEDLERLKRIESGKNEMRMKISSRQIVMGSGV